jgi:hypothetical protein
MLKLTDGMLLYHGSFTEVSVIDLCKCKQGKDFGRDFYVTSSYEQAKSFVPLSVNKQIKEGNLPEGYSHGYISVFRFHLSPDIAIHTFDSADKDWLHFVASNRRKSLFPTVRKNYAAFDIIGGKIANDRTARTLQLYTSGGYGEPGSKEADDIAITTLLPNRLEDQFCFCNEKAIKTLEFIRSDLYDTKHK